MAVPWRTARAPLPIPDLNRYRSSAVVLANGGVSHYDLPTSVLDSNQQQLIVAKLGRVEQQVRVIRKMIQQPELCAQILQQLAQAEDGLKKVSASVLKMHVETCVPSGVNTSEEEGRSRLSELVDIFDRFAK
jgi:CsoR family transcriptional regulator, copper-sensing transcriptional repressor